MKKINKFRLTQFMCLFVAFLMLMPSINIYANEQKASYHEEDANYETWMQTIYSRENGFSVGGANDIASTSDGIIWIGTYGGLYRYNGTKFQQMNQYEKARSVECLFVDQEDRLWIGSNDKGLSIYKNDILIGSLDTEDGLPSNAVRSIVQGADGKYYIGTSDRTVVVSFKDEPKIETVFDEIKYADKSTADKEGHVVMISSYGTMYLLKDGKILSSLEMETEDRFTSCVFVPSGQVYVGTAFGHVCVFDIQKNEFQQRENMECTGIRKVNNLIRINDETIFVCADNGIGYFKNNAFHLLETPGFDSNIYKVIMDYQGNLWFSSSRMGLLRLCQTSFIDLFTQYSIDKVVVNSTENYNGCIYNGTDNGLIIIDENNGVRVENELTQHFDGVRIRKVLTDRQNQLWFCTYGEGLKVFDGYEIKRIDEEGQYIGNRIRTVLEDKDGNIIVSSEKGIAYVRNNEVVKTFNDTNGLLNLINLCISQRKDGSILVGSDGDGLAIIKNDKVTTIGQNDGLPSGVILRIIPDQKGTGSFIVTSNALCYLEEDNTVKVFDHFPYFNNYDVIQSDDTLFVLGSAGIYTVNRDELFANQEHMKTSYLDIRAGLHDALVANSWNYVDTEHKKVYLSTTAGTTLFDLKAYDKRPSDFKIRVTSVVIDGKEHVFNDGDSINLSKNVRRLEINPEIINYSTVDPIVGCYLEGFDDKAIVMSQSELSSVVYTNLPAGKYAFNMRLMDSESGVIISNKVYYLERETKLTESIWFYIAVVMLMILVATQVGLVISRKNYTRNMSKKEKELERTWEISLHDDLTGLKNRLAMRLAFPKYVGKEVVVTMMDVDDFKEYNDTYGHEMGDRILKEIGAVITKHCKEPDVAFRYGGDEFLLIDQSGDLEKVKYKLSKLRRDIEKIRIEGCDEIITLTFGSEAGIPSSEEELRNMKNKADEQLYEKKAERKRI